MATRWTEIKNTNLKKALFQEGVMCTALTILAGKPSDFRDYILGRFGQDYGDQFQAVHLTLNHDNKTYLIINIPNNNKSAETVGLIAHELIHFIHQALREKGVNFSKGNEEVFSYLFAFYMKKIYESLEDEVVAQNEKKIDNKTS